MNTSVWQTMTALILLVPSQIVSRLYLRHRRQWWARGYRTLSDFWLGLSPILLCGLLVFEVIIPVFNLDSRAAAGWLMAITGLTGLLGFVNALVPRVKTIELTSAKLGKPLRIVQITDVHIGTRRSTFLDEVVYRINQLDADMLCITGDLIDATGVTEDELRSLQSVRVPVYFCIGNHEKYEDLKEIVERLENLGVVVLRNRSHQHETGVQVIGIDDMDDALQVERQLAHIEIAVSDFVLLLYHRPRGLEAASEAGVDLMLSGHTHNGQIFPFNLIVRQVFKRIVGLYQTGHTWLYVSQGTGTWGPVMRVGTRPEITLFKISPA